MIRNAASVALIAAFVFSVNVAGALAQGSSDPTKIGDNAKDMVEPNAKAIWWICAVVGLVYCAASRKAGRAGGIIGGLTLAGVVIYNPAGLGSFMKGVADGLF